MIHLSVLPWIMVPTAFELYLDRKGEARKNKPIQLVLLSVFSLALAIAIDWRLTIDWFRSLALMWGFHVLCFDYLIVIILRRNGVIRPDANWFTYTGTTSRIDQIVSRINPWLRFAIRVVIFALCLLIFAHGIIIHHKY